MTFGGDWGGTAETAEVPRMPIDDEVIAPDTRDARSREDTTSTSDESGMPECGSADATADPTADTDSDRSRGFVARLLARFGPPDIAGDRPGLAKLSAYAHYGAGAPADGPLRDMQLLWFRWVCRPITAWTYWKAWALERPFRGFLVLVAQIGWWVLNIITVAHFFL